MTKIICVKCQCELRPSTNGTVVVEMAKFGPYKMWEADALKCLGCGIEVVAGFADHAFAEHYEKGFDHTLTALEEHGRRLVYDFEHPQPPIARLNFGE